MAIINMRILFLRVCIYSTTLGWKNGANLKLWIAQKRIISLSKNLKETKEILSLDGWNKRIFKLLHADLRYMKITIHIIYYL